MRAAIDGVDVVGERVDVLGESLVVLERDLDGRPVLKGALYIYRLRMQHRMLTIQVPHERHDPAVEVEGRFARGPLIVEPDPERLVEIRGLAKPLRDGIEVEVDDGKDLRIGTERRDRAVLRTRCF